MARDCSGSIFEQPTGSGQWHGKFTTPLGRRSILLVTCRTREQAEARKQFIVEQLRRLREAGRAEFSQKLVELASQADGNRLHRVRRGVDAIVAGEFEKPGEPRDVLVVGPAFEEFAKQWTSGELSRRFPDHVPTKRSVGDDIYRLDAYVYPIVGSVALREFTAQHGELVMASLPQHLTAGTRRQVAQLVKRVLRLAVYPARMLDRNPLPVGFLPKAGPSLALAWLYPDEEARLLATRTVPLLHRLFYGVLFGCTPSAWASLPEPVQPQGSFTRCRAMLASEFPTGSLEHPPRFFA